MLAKIKDTTKASDDEIGRNLMGLARARPDVFGESSGSVYPFSVKKRHSMLPCPRRSTCSSTVPLHAVMGQL